LALIAFTMGIRTMTDNDATRLVAGNPDATRLAGESYRTRLTPNAAVDDKTRIAQQEGYQSKLARDAVNDKPDDSEFYKIGDKIGDRYEVSAIHHGAMGVVYGCFDHQTKLPRALKTVRSQHLNDKQVLLMFEDEAAIWLSLEKHPYIVRAYMVERFNNLPYVITEYVRGPEGMEGDLRGWLGHPRLTLPVAVAMALQIAQGMQHAVQKVPNLVHRDLKPGNILVNNDGKAMVTDFGLVNSAEAGAGTPAYMSPEQWRNDNLDVRSDIYSFGCILFEMFTGFRLFPALNEHDWKRSHLECTPAILTTLSPELPSEIDEHVRHCLEKRADYRPKNWDEIVDFYAEWYHRLTSKAVILDFSSISLDASELAAASYSLCKLNRIDESLVACERALAIEPNNATAWANKGAALGLLNRYEDSIKACERALEIDSSNAGAWQSIGLNLQNLNRIEDAIVAYDHSLEINPTNALAWYNKSCLLYALKRYELMLLPLSRTLEIDPIKAEAWNYRGLAFEQLNCFDDAILSYDKALEINRNDFGTWCNKGGVLFTLKRYEEALYAYDRAIAIEPNSYYVWDNKSNVLRKLNRYAESLMALDKAIELNPESHDLWINKGIVLHILKHFEEALIAYDRSLKINPKNAIAWYQMGLTLIQLESFEEAVNVFDQAISLNSNIAASWVGKARALSQLKLYIESIHAYDSALKINSGDERLWFEKGHSLLKLNRFEEALHAYEHAPSLDKNGAVSMIKGIALLKLQRFEEAIVACDRALELKPDFESALNSKNIALHELRQRDAAISALKPKSIWQRISGK